MVKKEATGQEIKDAAIAQNVPIEPEFVLSEETGSRKSRVVGNSEAVRLQNKQKFIAVAPDDNS